MKKYFLLFAIFITVPQFVHAAISITEVAWMGSSSSQYEEWIELYNDGDEVSVAGWKLFKSGGTVLFTLTGTIPPDSYYLVCRTTGTLTNPLAGACDEQGAWGGSGLNNTSDQVILKDAGAVSIETIDATAGWPAGDSASKQTMQKNSSGEWVTAAGTPGDENAGSGGENGEDDQQDDTASPTTSTAAKKDAKEKIEKIKPDPVYVAHMIIPDYGIAGVAVPIKAEVKKDKVFITKRGRFEWSLGDGASFAFRRNTDIAHAFQYPGDYTVVLAYYSDIFRDEPDTIHRKIITIAPASIAITGMTDDGGVIIENNSGKDVDLAGWSIFSNSNSFIFPKYTTITKDAELSISSKTLGFVVSKDVVVRNPGGIIIGRQNPSPALPQGEGAEQDTSSDWSVQNAAVSAEEKPSFVEKISAYKWYGAFGLLAIAAIIAYLFAKLYASRSEIESEAEDLDYDIL